MAWHRQPLTGFDLETTGTDPQESRIVTAAVLEVRAGELTGRREWLADPGVEIPADAVADAVADALASSWQAGVPVVAYNAAFYPLTSITSQLSQSAAVSEALR